MTAKQRVLNLLDTLPDETTYDEILEGVRRLQRQDLSARVEALHANAPDEDEELTDEELTPEELENIEISLEQIRRGEVVSRDKIMRKLDLD